MNTHELITLAGLGSTELSATDNARAERDRLLANAREIAVITSPQEAETAAIALRSLKGFTREIEEARATVKGPVLDLGKRVDDLAKELTNELDAEGVRLGKQIGAWTAEQKRLADEAERKAREEEARIWREAQEKERQRQEEIRRQEAEVARKAREEADALAAKAARARSEAGREKALQEAEAARIAAQIAADERQQREEADAKERDRKTGEAMVAARVAGMQTAPVKPAGVATREEIVFEVTDIIALHGAAPYLVTMIPNNAAIKNALKGMAPGQTLPGVTWRKEARTHVR